MQEFWVCQHCRSLNRAGSSKCYSCRTKFGNQPAAPETASRATAIAPLPQQPMPSFAAAPVASPQYAQLASVAPAAAASLPVSGRRPRLGSPIAAVKRRVVQSLSVRPSVSVRSLGYVTAAMLVLMIVFGALLLLLTMPAEHDLLQNADIGSAWAQLPSGEQAVVEALSIAMLISVVLAWLCFSLFVGLTTHNATGLRAEQPLLSPYRAGTCWTGMLWTQARISVGLIVPAVLVWQNYIVLGLAAALVAVEIAHHNLEDQFSWLERPARHLPDLYIKLGVEGSISSRLASSWSACFRIANVMAILVSAAPLVALTAFLSAVLAGRQDLVGWQSSGFGTVQVMVALLVANLIGWSAATVALLVPITVGLTKRQQTRRTLVRVGRSRSWVARPGEGGYTPGTKRPTATYDAVEDEDRIVERLPRLPLGVAAEPDGGSRTGSGPGDATQESPNQASLYSPSTTSSFPWSVEPPSEPD